jgi:hypothetical protein
MVIVITTDAVNVYRYPCSLREALQTVRYHLTAQISNLLPLQSQINDTEWPIR